MERYNELMGRVCAYVTSKLKPTALREGIWYSEYVIIIVLDSDLVDNFTYTTNPQDLENCLIHNGCITPIAEDVLRLLRKHINNTFFKYD